MSSDVSGWSASIRNVQQTYGAFAFAVQQLLRVAVTEGNYCAPASDRRVWQSTCDELSSSVTTSAEAFCAGLENLDAMSEAMECMKSAGGGSADPSATWGLLLNLVGLFVKQLQMQEADVVSSLGKAQQGVGQMKQSAARLLSPSTTPTSRNPPTGVQSRINAPHDSDDDGSSSHDEQVARRAPPATTTLDADTPASGTKKLAKKTHKQPVAEASTEQETAPKKKAVKKKKKDSSEVHTDPVPVEVFPMGVVTNCVATPIVAVKKKKSPAENGASRTADDTSSISGVVLATAGSSAKQASAISTRQASGTNSSDAGSNVSASFASAKAPWEPDCLKVVTGITDAMGPLIASARPNVYTAPEDILSSPLVGQEYCITLDPPGHLSAVLVRGWINVDRDIDRDFACDILNVDSVESEPFSHVGKEISVADEEDVRGLPACGWRQQSSDDHTKKLHTCYMFVDDPKAPNSKCLHIHNVVIIGASKEEVLTVVTPIAKSLGQYASVQIFSPNLKSRRGPANNSAASGIVSMTKDILEHCGFAVASLDEVKAFIAAQQAEANHSNGPVTEDSSTVENFNDPEAVKYQTQKAISAFGKVVGITKSLALAPVTATLAVTNLVAKTAETAMLSQTDPKFKEWFPHLAAEIVVDTYNCALSEGVLKQGILYLTSRWLAFHATVFSRTATVEFDDVKDIRKEKTMKIFDNAIEVETFDGQKLFFTNFINRDAAYALIFNTWRSSGA